MSLTTFLGLALALEPLDSQLSADLAAAAETEAVLRYDIARELATLAAGRSDGQDSDEGDQPSINDRIDELTARLAALSSSSRTPHILERYYKQALHHSAVWFAFSVGAAVVGLTVIVWQVIEATNHPALETLYRVTPGILTTAIAYLFYRQANATRQHARELLADTEAERRFHEAMAELDKLPDEKLRAKSKAELAVSFGLSRPSARPRPGSGQKKKQAARKQ